MWPPSRKLGTQNLNARFKMRAAGSYLPAAAPVAAAAGFVPAIFIPSILLKTDSRLAPVSVQASTYGCRLPSMCNTSTLVSALAFLTMYGR